MEISEQMTDMDFINEKKNDIYETIKHSIDALIRLDNTRDKACIFAYMQLLNKLKSIPFNEIFDILYQLKDTYHAEMTGQECRNKFIKPIQDARVEFIQYCGGIGNRQGYEFPESDDSEQDEEGAGGLTPSGVPRTILTVTHSTLANGLRLHTYTDGRGRVVGHSCLGGDISDLMDLDGESDSTLGSDYSDSTLEDDSEQDEEGAGDFTIRFHTYAGSSYFPEWGDPFDPANEANWDGDQQIGFRD